jgi:oligopeptide transport system substrate-binding protein
MVEAAETSGILRTASSVMTMESLRPALHPLRAAAALAVGLLGGCRHGTRVEDGNREGIVSIANDAEPPDLDPNTNIDISTEYILNTLFEGLVALSNDGHTVIPGVAERWEVSADGLAYTFHLRPDARWSNGAALTSDDFLVSFQRVFDPLVACELSSVGFAIQGAEAYALGRNPDPATLGLSAPDAHTFVVRLAHPSPYFLGILAKGTPFMPVYRPLLEKFGGVHRRGTPWTREGNLVGNGPFVLTRWTQNQTIEVRQNPLYWDAARVRLKGVNFFTIDNASIQEQGFRVGEFHIAMKFPIYKAPAYAGAQPTALHLYPLQQTHFLTFNVTRAPFTDARVRRAFSMAIDRRKLCAAVFHAFAEPAFVQVRPGTGGYTPPIAASYQLNPAEARRLLAEAGFPQGRGFPAVDLMLVGNDPETMAMGEVVQAAWREVLGITTQLLPTEKKVYLDAERTKHFQMVIERWGYAWDDPSAYYQTGQSGNPNNDSGWSDPEFDRAYREAELNLDPRARTAAFDRQEGRMAASVPYAPLYFYKRPVLIAPSVRGWSGNPQDHIEWKEIWLEP